MMVLCFVLFGWLVVFFFFFFFFCVFCFFFLFGGEGIFFWGRGFWEEGKGVEK